MGSYRADGAIATRRHQFYRMKLTIPTKTLSTLVSRAKPVAGGTLPITQCFLLSAKDGELALSANDLNLGISGVAQCKIGADGAIAINASRFSKAVSAFTSEEIILAADSKNNLEIRSGKNVLKLCGLGAEEFPEFPFPKETGKFSLTQKETRRILGAVLPFASEDQTRYVLNGVGIVEKEKQLVFCATDGKTMRVEQTEIPTPGLAIIPTASAKLIRDSCGDSDSVVEFTLAENAFTACSGGWRIIGKLIEGSFPQWQQIIPYAGKSSITFDKEEMIRALRMTDIASDENNVIRISQGDGKIINLSAQLADTGSADVEVNGSLAKMGFAIGFNSRFIRKIADSFVGPEITISLEDAMSPALAREGNGLAVAMPIRIS